MGGLSALTDLVRSRPSPAAAAAAGWARRSTTLQRLYPHLASSGLLIPGAAAYAFGNYTQLSAAASADYLPQYAHLGFRLAVIITFTGSHLFQVEIATGAANQEALHSRLVAAFACSFTQPDGVTPGVGTGFTLPLGVTQIPSGTRIAARVRTSNPNTTVASHVGLYVAGFDAPSPDSDLTYPLAGHLNNDDTSQSLVTPYGAVNTITAHAYPNYSAWQEVIAAAPSDLLVHGVAYALQFIAGITGTHFQLGIGSANNEVPYEVLGLPDCPNFMGAGVQTLRRPLLVLSGERLAVRAASTGATVTIAYHVLYEQI